MYPVFFSGAPQGILSHLTQNTDEDSSLDTMLGAIENEHKHCSLLQHQRQCTITDRQQWEQEITGSSEEVDKPLLPGNYTHKPREDVSPERFERTTKSLARLIVKVLPPYVEVLPPYKVSL